MIAVDDGEQRIAVFRKHWLPFGMQALALALGAALPALLIAFVPRALMQALAALPHADAVVAFFYLLWLLALWMMLFMAWTNYWFDVWILTDRRIIDVDQVSLFHRKMVSAGLEKIQDTHVEVEGVLTTLFGFGTLVLYTAGENPDIVIENAARPYDAKEAIRAARDAMVALRGHGEDAV